MEKNMQLECLYFVVVVTFIIDIQYAGRGFEGVTALQGL